MSSNNSTKIINIEFISRLVELFGTDKPADIGRKLKVDYQSAKNYLHGRKPNAEVLERVVEVTDVSLNWLLMGQGPKYLREEFDVERSIQIHDDWPDVMQDWYAFEGGQMPDTMGASFMGGWKGFTMEEKVAALRDFKMLLDRMQEKHGAE